MPTSQTLYLGEALAADGTLVPAWGFDHAGDFIVNARLSPCGRFGVGPEAYGMTHAQADYLATINAGRDLFAYEVTA